VRSDPICEECGSPLDDDQRYCLNCGARIGPPSSALETLLGNLRAAQVPEAPPVPAQAPSTQTARASGLTLPAPRVSALLVLVFLGFGALLGDAASPHAGESLASSRSPVKLVLPRTSASAAPASTPATSPPATGEATPTPTESSSTSSSTPNSKPATSKASPGASSPSSSGSEGEASGSPSAGSPAQGSAAKPPVKHVFVIMLAEQPYASVFGPASSAPYLSQTLEARGELLVRYYAVAHQGLANGIALLSGQGPTVETAADCPRYTSIEPAAAGADQQVSGSGCVYPRSTQTLTSQLSEKHLSWRAYIEGMDEGGASGACAHPALGQSDPTSSQPPPAGGQTYATARNPFVYFHSVIDTSACAADDVGLKELGSDLGNPARAPSFSYIVPDLCHDGSAAPCAPGAPAGPADADGFLQKVVPEITSSKAYKQGGLLVITVDQAPSSGPFADSSSCCGQPQFPNLPAPVTTIKGLPSKAGGQVGALLLSPYVKAGTTNSEQYNHFSLLRTIEDLFGLKHLGYAGLSSVTSFDSAVFSAYKSG